MDSEVEALYESLQEFDSSNQMNLSLSAQDSFHGLDLEDLNLNPGRVHPSFNHSLYESFPYLGGTVQGHQQDDYDFGDLVLNYISQVLMEEDEDERIRASHASCSLEATEKLLYEAIGKEYSPPQDHSLVPPPSLAADSSNKSKSSDRLTYFNQSHSGHPDGYKPVNVTDSYTSSKSSSWSSSHSSNGLDIVSDNHSQIPFNLPNSSDGVTVDALAEASSSGLKVTDIFNGTDSIIQFKKGIEEASKFLQDSSLYIGLGTNNLPDERARDVTKFLSIGFPHVGMGGNQLPNQMPEEEGRDMEAEERYLVAASRGKKHRIPEDVVEIEQARGSKQSALSIETVVRSEMFDKILLCSEGAQGEAALREALQKRLNKNCQTSLPKRSSTGGGVGKGRGRKPRGKKDVVDLRSLLTQCAQSVSVNDHRSAYELLKKIRQHSSPKGDGYQRMSYYFANGLEDRLAGMDTPIHTFIVTGSASAADLLRAYQFYLVTCPFKKLGNFFSNRTIMKTVAKATKVHIIDYGMVFGYQWPCLIQQLSKRPGGPPKLRITGIDLPTPGFRPAKRVEETGRRLSNYAESFNVPFEFNAIAKKWETVTEEELMMREDEVLIVNCMFRFKCLLDETVMEDCPRDIVLKQIRDIKPHVFIHGISNGSFSSPFFLTRFREALFHFSTMFDIMEATAPRDSEERAVLERELFGRQAMNVIACEGADRNERPETYKKWQVRNERIGFKQLPLDKEIVEIAKDRVRSDYHKDFVIDVDGQWLLQGWKGRIVYALTCWKPNT